MTIYHTTKDHEFLKEGTKEVWQERFDKQFAMACAQVTPEFEADIKAFIATEIQAAEERGYRSGLEKAKEIVENGFEGEGEWDYQDSYEVKPVLDLIEKALDQELSK